MPSQALNGERQFGKALQYRLPKITKNSEGEQRKVGIELEYTGIDSKQSAALACKLLGGTIEHTTPHITHLRDSGLGDIEFMLDTQYVHPKTSDEPVSLQKTRETLGTFVSDFVPQELVTAPIPLNNLYELDQLTSELTKAGAKGTHESILYAFGLHINPEIASSSPEYLLSVIRSIIILEDEVRKTIQPDFSRDLMRWTKGYTPQYCTHVMNESYLPDLATLISDYIRLNPGRSYHLDILPIFRHLQPDTVNALIGEKCPASRPAFHYRLPNSGLGIEEWTIRNDWNVWVEIEDYATEIGMSEIRQWRETKATE